MRHRKVKKTLDRKAGSRVALMKGLLDSLFLYERIDTTRAKALAVKPLAERLITNAAAPTLASIRSIEAHLLTKGARAKLIKEIGPRYKEGRGGHVRVIARGKRKGDGAEIVEVALI